MRKKLVNTKEEAQFINIIKIIIKSLYGIIVIYV